MAEDKQIDISAGFVDNPPAATPDTTNTPQNQPSLLGRVGKGLHDLVLGTDEERGNAGMSPQEVGLHLQDRAVTRGAAKGLTETLQGGSQMLGKVADKTGLRSKGLSDLITNQQTGIFGETPEKIELNNAGEVLGYGGESLVEFIMGDEALKGLSIADKLLQAGKVAKILEKSPKLINALKIGAGAGKAMAELGPEERAAIQKSPILARLVNAGMDAIRAGAVSGTQTLVKTGGDVGAASKDAAKMAGTSMLFGAPFATAGGILSKGRVAASTVAKMSDAASHAVSEQGLASTIADGIVGESDKLDSALESATNKAGEELATSQAGAANVRSLRNEAADQLFAERQQAHRQRLEQSKNTAADTLAKSQGDAHQNLLTSLDSVSQGAMDPKDLATAVNDAINHTEAQSHKLYEDSISNILDRLRGAKEPISGSPLSSRAQELLREPAPEDHAIVALAKQGTGNKLDKDVKTFLESLASGQQAKEAGAKSARAAVAGANVAGEAGSVQTAAKPLADLDAEALINLRQEVRQWAAGYTRGDVNARALNRLLPAIDDTLAKLANKSGDPQVIDLYGQLRSAYRNAREVLDSNTAEKLNLQRPDQAMNDVGKYLLGGANPSAKIRTLRQAVGDGVMQDIAKSKIQQLRQIAEFDPEKFLKEWQKIPGNVKQDFFGNDLTRQVQQATDTYSKTTADATQAHGAAVETAKNVNKVQQIGNKADFNATKELIDTRYKQAVSDAQQAYDSAVKTAKETHAVASEPFKGSFMRQLANGRVNDALLKGQVDVQDIRNVKKAIGDAKWQNIGDGIFQRAVADASPKGRFDPGKMMDWWKGINPDVRQEMFNFDPNKYESAIQDVKGAASFQKLVKAGVLSGTLAATGTGLAKAGLLAEVIAASSGVAGHKLVSSFVNWAANHPQMWKSISGLSKAADSDIAGQANRIVRYGAYSALAGDQ